MGHARPLLAQGDHRPLGPGTVRPHVRLQIAVRRRRRLSFGSDWPAASYYSTFRPLEAIEIAVTRQELGKPGQTPLPRPEERLTLDQAITAQTMGPAYQLHRENELGSITVGKLADLVVLDKDLTTIPPSEIHQTNVKLTMMNGVVRYEK